MIKVYKSDRLEKESTGFLWKMVVSGVLSTLLAMIAERIGSMILGRFVSPRSALYNVILYFVIVGFAEEGAKYFMMKRKTWLSHEFNCLYDGVVYAVFVSLGFALWENISYVLHYGFSTALVRAVTAVPGHACFGVFMGVFYGLSRACAYKGDIGKSSILRVLAVLVPALIHGCYDYIASMETPNTTWIFIVFIAVMFGGSLALINYMSKNDRYISGGFR